MGTIYPAIKRLFFLSLLLGIFIIGSGQSDSINKILEKNLTKYIEIPISYHNDSCSYSNTLIRLIIDKNSNITVIDLSDNAENWLINQFGKIRGRLDKMRIKEFIKNNKIRNQSIIVPLIIHSGMMACKDKKRTNWFTSAYFRFNGRILNAHCRFTEPAEIVVYPMAP
jgi:hypothetical protein